MHRQLAVATAVLLAACAAALAKDRPVTSEESAKLVAALSAEGCSGGKMEFDDDGHFEVDGAKCSDGRSYDLELDASFKVTKKKLDD